MSRFDVAAVSIRLFRKELASFQNYFLKVKERAKIFERRKEVRFDKDRVAHFIRKTIHLNKAN